MEPETKPADEIETGISEKDAAETHAYFKQIAQLDQPHFLLIGQDELADLAVEVWVSMYQFAQSAMAEGKTIEQVRGHIRVKYGLFPWEVPMDNPKLAGALKIAQEMRAYPARRLAD